MKPDQSSSNQVVDLTVSSSTSGNLLDTSFAQTKAPSPSKSAFPTGPVPNPISSKGDLNVLKLQAPSFPPGPVPPAQVESLLPTWVQMGTKLTLQHLIPPELHFEGRNRTCFSVALSVTLSKPSDVHRCSANYTAQMSALPIRKSVLSLTIQFRKSRVTSFRLLRPILRRYIHECSPIFLSLHLRTLYAEMRSRKRISILHNQTCVHFTPLSNSQYFFYLSL